MVLGFLHVLISCQTRLCLCFKLYVSHLSQIIRQVSCGAVHAVALSEDGLLQAWGNIL